MKDSKQIKKLRKLLKTDSSCRNWTITEKRHKKLSLAADAKSVGKSELCPYYSLSYEIKMVIQWNDYSLSVATVNPNERIRDGYIAYLCDNAPRYHPPIDRVRVKRLTEENKLQLWSQKLADCFMDINTLLEILQICRERMKGEKYTCGVDLNEWNQRLIRSDGFVFEDKHTLFGLDIYKNCLHYVDVWRDIPALESIIKRIDWVNQFLIGLETNHIIESNYLVLSPILVSFLIKTFFKCLVKNLNNHNQSKSLFDFNSNYILREESRRPMHGGSYNFDLFGYMSVSRDLLDKGKLTGYLKAVTEVNEFTLPFIEEGYLRNYQLILKNEKDFREYSDYIYLTDIYEHRVDYEQGNFKIAV